MRAAAKAKTPPEILSLLGVNITEEDPKFGRMEEQKVIEGKLPSELMDMVREYFEEDQDMGLMGLEEAKGHRLELMEERSRFVETTREEWEDKGGYNFCEH